jgi:hypothetical protein
MWQPPKRWTFEMQKVRRYVEKEAEGHVLNLFAGKTRPKLKETRVDISPEFEPDYCMDCVDFLKMWIKEKKPLFDTIILDPPYNARKAMEKYRGKYTNKWIQVLKLAGQVLKPKGKAICLGFNSVGFSKRKGFKKEAICLVCHGSGQNDTIILTERKNFVPITQEEK